MTNRIIDIGSAIGCGRFAKRGVTLLTPHRVKRIRFGIRFFRQLTLSCQSRFA
jgi:hypothetical protein